MGILESVGLVLDIKILNLLLDHVAKLAKKTRSLYLPLY
jgi:hypothetical protein